MPDLLAVLLEMQRGQTAALANRKFGELLDAVKETRKKGKLVITLDVTPSEFDTETNEVSRVTIDPEIKLTRPEKDLGRGIYFLTKEGDLSRQDPRQQEMFEDADEGAKDGRYKQ